MHCFLHLLPSAIRETVHSKQHMSFCFSFQASFYFYAFTERRGRWIEQETRRERGEIKCYKGKRVGKELWPCVWRRQAPVHRRQDLNTQTGNLTHQLVCSTVQITACLIWMVYYCVKHQHTELIQCVELCLSPYRRTHIS